MSLPDKLPSVIERIFTLRYQRTRDGISLMALKTYSDSGKEKLTGCKGLQLPSCRCGIALDHASGLGSALARSRSVSSEADSSGLQASKPSGPAACHQATQPANSLSKINA